MSGTQETALTLARDRELPEACRSLLSQLGKSLGQLDLAGQLRGLDLHIVSRR